MQLKTGVVKAAKALFYRQVTLLWIKLQTFVLDR